LASALLFTFYLFAARVLPSIHEPIGNFEFPRSLPYIFILLSFVLLWRLRSNRIESYKEFLCNSPGVAVATTGITYGVGHPTEPSEGEQTGEVDQKPGTRA